MADIALMKVIFYADWYYSYLEVSCGKWNMKHFFWLIEGELGGGDAWLLQTENVGQLAGDGIQAVLSFSALSLQQLSALSDRQIDWHVAEVPLSAFPE
ncbi:MAG: hypothetical protein LPH20_15045, partial [Shewanella sp.]|nr:hypothetical protein [Shewanella sp.]